MMNDNTMNVANMIGAEEAASRAVEQRREELRLEHENNKKKLIKISSILIFISITLVFMTRSWFTMSREVEGSKAQMTGEALPFELEVRGDNIENDGDFSKADSEYVYGENLNLTPTAYQTSGNHDSIIWRKTGSSADDGHYDNGLVPDSHGKLTFWVVPQSTGSLDISFEMKIRGYIATYAEPANDEDESELLALYEINDDLAITTQNKIKNNSELNDIKEAIKYLRGHILFFTNYDSSTGYYSGFCGTERKVDFGNCINPNTGEKYAVSGGAVSVTKGEKYPVTLYWKWANTFEQMVLDDDSPNKDSPLFAVGSSNADRLAVYTYLSNSTSNKVFVDLNRTSITTNLGYVKNNDATHFSNALKTLTDSYNNADSLIGENVDYFIIEMTANTN